MRFGDDFPKKHDLSSLRVLGTVGEPINPEAWLWYYEGAHDRQFFLIFLVKTSLPPSHHNLSPTFLFTQNKSHWQQTVLCRRHVVADGDWWSHADAAARCYPNQTRLGRKCEPRPKTGRQFPRLFPWTDLTDLCSACLMQTLPMLGVVPALVDKSGHEIKVRLVEGHFVLVFCRSESSNLLPSASQGPGEGYLVIKKPWPGQMRTVYGDHDRFEMTYFSQFDGYYCTGDGAYLGFGGPCSNNKTTGSLSFYHCLCSFAYLVGARRDEHGYYWITGRVDDVINVGGSVATAFLNNFFF